jgi:hypothetical protein
MVIVDRQNILLLDDEMLEETVCGLLLDEARDLFKQSGPCSVRLWGKVAITEGSLTERAVP